MSQVSLILKINSRNKIFTLAYIQLTNIFYDRCEINLIKERRGGRAIKYQIMSGKFLVVKMEKSDLSPINIL